MTDRLADNGDGKRGPASLPAPVSLGLSSRGVSRECRPLRQDPPAPARATGFTGRSPWRACSQDPKDLGMMPSAAACEPRRHDPPISEASALAADKQPRRYSPLRPRCRGGPRHRSISGPHPRPLQAAIPSASLRLRRYAPGRGRSYSVVASGQVSCVTNDAISPSFDPARMSLPKERYARDRRYTRASASPVRQPLARRARLEAVADGDPSHPPRSRFLPGGSTIAAVSAQQVIDPVPVSRASSPSC